jgi:hypothetical protein
MTITKRSLVQNNIKQSLSLFETLLYHRLSPTPWTT